MTSRSQAALTLIELLVAAALFAVLGAGLFQFVRGALDVWAGGERNRELAERAGLAFELMTEDLRAVWSGVTGAGPDDARFLCEWRDEEATGDGRAGRRVQLLRFSRLAHESRRLPWLAAAGEQPGALRASALLELENPAELLPTSGLAESLYTLARLPGRQSLSLVRRVRLPLGGEGSLLEPGLAADRARLLAGAVEIADRVLHLGVSCFAPESEAFEATGDAALAVPDSAVAPTEWDSAGSPGSAPAGVPRLVALVLVLDPHEPGRGGPVLDQELGLLDTVIELRGTALPGEAASARHLLVDDEWLEVVVRDGRRLTVRRGAFGSAPAVHAAGARLRAGRAFERVVALPAAREVLLR